MLTRAETSACSCTRVSRYSFEASSMNSLYSFCRLDFSRESREARPWRRSVSQVDANDVSPPVADPANAARAGRTAGFRAPGSLTGQGRRFGDQPRTALPGEIGPEPLGLHPQPVLQLRKRHEVQEHPDKPGDEPVHAEAPALQNREILADDRHVAFVEISER